MYIYIYINQSYTQGVVKPPAKSWQHIYMYLFALKETMWSIIVFVFRWSNHNDINSHPLFFWKWHQLPSSALDSCSDCNWAWRSCLQGVTQPNGSQFDFMVGKSAFIAKAGKTLHWFDYLMQNELQLHGSIFIYVYSFMKNTWPSDCIQAALGSTESHHLLPCRCLLTCR